ncbi:MAG: LacI family DNA-binding transcriptional regulator [Bacteroidota bacterium]
MKQKITLKHIARELEVSVSTVSKALKNSQEISKDTIEKVQAFAKLYNYRPNNVAISLKNKRTKNIGVIIPDIVHHFFTTVFRGIEKYANERGYNVIVCVSDESFDKEVINMELLANGSVDGFIMALSADTQLKNDYNHLKEVMDQGIPLVLFDRITEDVQCDKVVINDREIAHDIVSRFLDQGRKRVALVTTDSYLNVSNKRAEGYYDALKEREMEIDENLIIRLPYSYIGLDQVDLESFFRNQQVDAAFCVNEMFAVHCMGVVQGMGLRVPQDIPFVGFTDGMLSKYVSPPLTTVFQHGQRMGEMAAQMLIERVEEDHGEELEKPFRTKVIEATLIARDSTIND